MKPSERCRELRAAGLWPPPGRRRGGKLSNYEKPEKRDPAPLLAICATCEHARPNGCKLVDAMMAGRTRTSRGGGGCGKFKNDPDRYFRLMLKGAPHPTRSQCRWPAR